MRLNRQTVKNGDWGISWEEYKELTYFCLQYEQKKKDAAALLTLKLSTPIPITYHKKVGGVSIEYGEFLPHGGNRTSDPTATTAEKRDRILQDVRLIEAAARATIETESTVYEQSAKAGLYSSLLKAVTQRGGVQAVMANPNTRPPCGERQFYTLRRKFFWILREMRNGDLLPLPNYLGQQV